ncbi:MAG: Uma2 family endonuclease [Chloroflexota bacterium]|nr:Uma2 family endonuclease [Chloroflexota bacterium]
MAAPLPQPRYSQEEYLAYERQAEYKSEYIDGQIIAMAGASREHNLVTTNLLRVISNQLLDRPCEVYTGDMRVKITAQGMYTYPDIVAVCGDPQFEDKGVDTLLNPTVIIEVLSPSTALYDRATKFAYYRQLPSLQEYLLVAQDQRLIEHFVRTTDGWLLTDPADPAVLQLPAIGCTVSLAEVYRKVVLSPAAAADSHT